jgi:hypothetical protein
MFNEAKYKIVFCMAVTLAALLPFQNCSRNQSSTSVEKSLSSFDFQATSGGNGEYYGGKLSAGVYSRPIPNLKCGLENSLGVIEVSRAGDISGTFVDPVSCSATKLSLAASDVEQAEYDPTRLGLGEGIYIKKSKLIDEAWCRTAGSSSTTGYDIVVNADYSKQIFRSSVVAGRMVNGKLEKYVYASPDLRRDVDLDNRIRYRSGESNESFRLDIDTRTFDRTSGKMLAIFKFDSGPFDSEVNLECRVGGELDIHFSSKPYNLADVMPWKVFGQLASLIFDQFSI